MPVFTEKYGCVKKPGAQRHYTDWVNEHECYTRPEIETTRAFAGHVLHTGKYGTGVVKSGLGHLLAASVVGLAAGVHMIDAFAGEIGRPRLRLAGQNSGYLEPVPSFLILHDSYTEMERAIEETYDLLQLPQDWDGEGARAISKLIVDATAGFLREYAHYLDRNHGKRLPIPEINPCGDDSIDLSWHADQAQLLINIRMSKGEPFAYFYGDRYNDKSPFKGNTSIEDFSEPLAVWMKHLI